MKEATSDKKTESVNEFLDVSRPIGDLLKELQAEDVNKEAKAVQEKAKAAIKARGSSRPRGRCRVRGTEVAFEKLAVQEKASESESEYYTAASTFDESSQEED